MQSIAWDGGKGEAAAEYSGVLVRIAETITLRVSLLSFLSFLSVVSVVSVLSVVSLVSVLSVVSVLSFLSVVSVVSPVCALPSLLSLAGAGYAVGKGALGTTPRGRGEARRPAARPVPRLWQRIVALARGAGNFKVGGIVQESALGSPRLAVETAAR